MARVIVVAEPGTDPPGTNRDRRTFELAAGVPGSLPTATWRTGA